MKKPLESAVLSAVKAEARRHSLQVIRFAFMPGTSAGWPDTLCLGPGGHALFIETKRPGGELRPLQAERFRALQAFEFHTAKIDTVEDAHATVLRFAAMCHGVVK